MCSSFPYAMVTVKPWQQWNHRNSENYGNSETEHRQWQRKHMRYERKVWAIDLRIVKNWQPPGIEPRASDISETVAKKSHEV